MKTPQGLNGGPRPVSPKPDKSAFSSERGNWGHTMPGAAAASNAPPIINRTPTASLIGLEQLQEYSRLNEQDEIERLLGGIMAVLNGLDSPPLEGRAMRH